jgi:hypothetical protein
MKLTKLRLTLNVDLDPQGESVNTLKHHLTRVIRAAIDNGTVTGESEATVEDYSFTVTERRGKKHSVNLAQVENDVSAIAAEQQRRDEKHGLFGEREDFAS